MLVGIVFLFIFIWNISEFDNLGKVSRITWITFQIMNISLEVHIVRLQLYKVNQALSF